MERVFVRIAEELNGGVPQGEQWHRQLLADMSLEIRDVRPAVIDPALAHDLGKFLRFRRLFRNAYGFVLEAERMQSLEDRLPAVLAASQARLRAFVAWMVDDGD